MKLASIVLASLLASGAVAQSTFQILGTGGLGADMSADGSVVAWVDRQNHPVRWTPSTGAQVLPSTVSDYRIRVSADGSTLAYATGSGAYRWRSSSGAELLDARGVQIGGVSANGQVISLLVSPGVNTVAPVRWSGGVSQPIPELALGTQSLSDISRDGSTVFGTTRTTNGGTPFFWTSSEGSLPLAGVAGEGTFDITGTAMNATGTRFAGWGIQRVGTALVFGFAYWSSPSSGRFIPAPIGFDAPIVNDMTADGRVIVGNGFPGAFVWWDGQEQPVKLQKLLTQQFGVNLTGYTLLSVESLSDDGTRLVGWAQDNITGQQLTYLVTLPTTLPAPGTAAVLMLAGLIAARRRRDSTS